MLMFSFVAMAWEEIFGCLITFGKILMFPFFVVFSILMLPFAFVEFFFIDTIVFLLLLLTEDGSPKDFVDYIKN